MSKLLLCELHQIGQTVDFLHIHSPLLTVTLLATGYELLHGAL
jgi:hypothetical protein